MCKLCNGTGGVTINFGYYAEFHPCKHPDCDFDREKAWKETDEIINRFKREMQARESA